MTPFTSVEGPSFPVAIKLLATVGVGGLLVTAWGARTQLAEMSLPPDLLWLAGLAAMVVVWHYLHIMFSTTAISGAVLSQGWLWRTSVALSDISQVKLLRMKSLDALVAPRLVVRTRGVGNLTFHAADATVLAVIDLLVHGQSEFPTLPKAATPLSAEGDAP